MRQLPYKAFFTSHQSYRAHFIVSLRAPLLYC